MTGDAPQPGETPRTEANPWSFDPDAAWWRGDGDREQAEALAEAAARPRHPRRRPVPTTPASATMAGIAPAAGEAGPFLGEEADAHATGVQDAAEALTSPAALVEEERAGVIENAEAMAAADAVADAADAEPETAERTHDVRTKDRYHPPEPVEGHAGDDAPDVSEVMVLPEPNEGRNRPTVPIDRGPLPGQPSLLDRLNPPRRPAADLDIKRSRLENSPFWLTDEQRAAADNTPAAPIVPERPEVRRGREKRPRIPHRAGPSLIGLIALALVAAFFSWVSAEPFWLAVGHGTPGVATVARCTGSGVTQRCAGTFTAGDGSFETKTVTLLGVDPAGRGPGSVARARMVDPKSGQAYVGTTGLLVHLRWVLGFVLVLLCGLGIAGLTGVRRLDTVRARRGALVMSLFGPLVLLTGFLLAAY